MAGRAANQEAPVAPKIEAIETAAAQGRALCPGESARLRSVGMVQVARKNLLFSNPPIV
jgi:hypothetical protein